MLKARPSSSRCACRAALSFAHAFQFTMLQVRLIEDIRVLTPVRHARSACRACRLPSEMRDLGAGTTRDHQWGVVWVGRGCVVVCGAV